MPGLVAFCRTPQVRGPPPKTWNPNDCSPDKTTTMKMNTCKTDIAMSRNTRTLEKNRFVCLVRLSIVRPLSERELCEAETSYERYVGSVQRLLVPGRFSPADTLHTLARAKMRLVRLRDAAAKVPSELLPLLDAAIELTKFEIRMIHLRVVHPDIMNAPEDARCPKSPIYLAEGFTPTDLMELVAGMQGLGVGRLIDGSMVSVETFAEAVAWLFNVRIRNPDQARHAVVNRKLRLTRFLDRLRGYLIEESRK